MNLKIGYFLKLPLAALVFVFFSFVLGSSILLAVEPTLKITVEESPDEKEIVLFAEPSEGGTVTGGGSYEFGTEVEIEAEPSTGYEFVYWLDESDNEISDNPVYSFTVDRSREIRGVFELKSYDVVLNKFGDGYGSVSGAGTYEYGSIINLEATSDYGSGFVGWYKDGTKLTQNKTLSWEVEEDVVLGAFFALNEYELELSTRGDGSGDLEGEGIYKHGEEVSLVAISDDDSRFVGWYRDDEKLESETSYVFTIEEDLELYGEFELVPDDVFVINAFSSEGGEIEPSGEVLVDEGDSKTFTFEPDEGFGIFEVFVDGESQGRLTDYTFDNVADDHEIEVVFARLVDISLDIVGSGDVDFDISDRMVGEVLEISEEDIIPATGFEFVELVILDDEGEISLYIDNLPYYYGIEGDFELIVIFEEVDDLVSRVTEDISGAVGTFADSIRALDVDDNIVRTTSMVVGAAVIPLTAFSLLSSQFGMYYYLMQLFLGILGIMGLRKKGKPYGVIYNSVTKEPINRAIVRVYDTAGKLVHTDVSDVYGVFSGELQDGNYTMEVFARGYEFPSDVVSGSEDKPYTNIYRGGEFTLDVNNPLQYSIPLDPLEVDRIKYAQAIRINKITNYLGFLQKILIFIGLLLSIFVYIRIPSVLNLLIMCVYILLSILSFSNIFYREKRYGKVESEELDVSEVVLSLRDSETGELFSKRVCDKNGHYRFIVPGGKYRLEVMNEGYKLSRDYTFEGPEDKPLLINPRVRVLKSKEKDKKKVERHKKNKKLVI